MSQQENAAAARPPLEVAVLGGGCFWCLEPVFGELRGVHEVRSGYAGGARPNPSYEQVCTGATGHAEVVRVSFDPEVISFALLLDVFFSLHDPTTLNRQGNDVGTQYRSVIFCQNEAQRKVAQAALEKLNNSGSFPVPAVTELAGPAPFYVAEDYHQDYFKLHGHEPYCSFVVSPKVAKSRKRFASLLKT
jgi:peptide-methionine (S)-S-oxide reductase